MAKFTAVVAARRNHDAVHRRARVLAGADDGPQRKIGGGPAQVLANRRAPQPGGLVVGPHDGHAAQPEVADVHLEARPAADGVARVAIDRVDGREAVDEHVLRRRAPRGERLRQPALARAKLDVHRRRRVDEAEAADRVDDRLVLHRVLLRLEAAGAVVRHARDAAVAAHSVVERRVRAFDAADQREQLLARDDAELRRARRRFQRVVDRAARDGRGARRLRAAAAAGAAAPALTSRAKPGSASSSRASRAFGHFLRWRARSRSKTECVGSSGHGIRLPRFASSASPRLARWCAQNSKPPTFAKWQ